MKKLTLITFITLSIFLFGCENELKKLKEKPRKKNQIVAVIAYFENTIATDGSYDTEDDFNNTKEIVEIITVKNDEIFWCYDTQKLLKIEILGTISNAQIVYQSSNYSKIIVLEKQNIDGTYSIVPSESNGINGGKIIIKSGNIILKEINITYDGCL